MEKILVSACLLGAPLRYDGADNRCDHPLLDRWSRQGRLIDICPETAGGLPTPRPPAERRGGRVVTARGDDLTEAFSRGAAAAVDLCRTHDIRLALLAARSPSCGNRMIYDGRFSGRLIPGAGVTAERLQAIGVRVFEPAQIDELAATLNRLETENAHA